MGAVRGCGAAAGDRVRERVEPLALARGVPASRDGGAGRDGRGTLAADPAVAGGEPSAGAGGGHAGRGDRGGGGSRDRLGGGAQHGPRRRQDIAGPAGGALPPWRGGGGRAVVW